MYSHVGQNVFSCHIECVLMMFDSEKQKGESEAHLLRHLNLLSNALYAGGANYKRAFLDAGLAHILRLLFLRPALLQVRVSLECVGVCIECVLILVFCTPHIVISLFLRHVLLQIEILNCQVLFLQQNVCFLISGSKCQDVVAATGMWCYCITDFT